MICSPIWHDFKRHWFLATKLVKLAKNRGFIGSRSFKKRDKNKVRLVEFLSSSSSRSDFFEEALPKQFHRKSCLEPYFYKKRS